MDPHAHAVRGPWAAVSHVCLCATAGHNPAGLWVHGWCMQPTPGTERVTSSPASNAHAKANRVTKRVCKYALGLTPKRDSSTPFNLVILMLSISVRLQLS
jgi:hypothetical protein